METLYSILSLIYFSKYSLDLILYSFFNFSLNIWFTNGNNEGGTVQNSDYINVSGNSGYNITYTTENNTMTRYIGFIKGDNEYDIIVTTDTNNQNALDNVSSTLVNSIKIKG